MPPLAIHPTLPLNNPAYRQETEMSTPFKRGTGRLATDRFDFEDHIDGARFRHTADQIDLSPAVNVVGTDYSNVSGVINALAAFASTEGQGFIAVPDGYDTYHNSDSTPLTPYDATVPSLDAYLSDLLNNPNNPLHHRIRDGGIVLIKAGTYKIANTVSVPPGITLLGEGFGTKIINVTATQGMTAIQLPLFRIKADLTRTIDTGVDAVSQFMFARETKLFNLTIADNFVEPLFLGDLSYKNPQNINPNAPLVIVEEGANLTCDSIKFLGKTTYTGPNVTSVTALPIGLDSTVPIATGTIVTVQNCNIDGFSEAAFFHTSCPTFSYFTFRNNNVRVYGMLNGDPVILPNNCFLNLNSCNINVSSNYCYGNRSNVIGLAYLNASGSNPSVTGLGNYARIQVSNNNVLIDRTVNSTNTTFRFFTAGASPDSSLLDFFGRFNFVSTVLGNNLENVIGFSAGNSADPTGNAPIFAIKSDGAGSNQILINGPSITATFANPGIHGDVPAQVAGYLNLTINGTAFKVPFYNP
jgi:hypothetical protein